MIRILLTLTILLSVTGNVSAQSEPWLSDTYDANEHAASPAPVPEGGTGLVPCNGPDCDTCDAITLVNNVVTWLITFLSIIAVIVLVYVGFKLVVSQGNTSEWEKAKGMFVNVVIGIILVLAAWLIVDTLLLGLTGSGMTSISKMFGC